MTTLIAAGDMNAETRTTHTVVVPEGSAYRFRSFLCSDI